MKKAKTDFMEFPYTDKEGNIRNAVYYYRLHFDESGRLETVINSFNSILPKNSTVFQHFNLKYV